MHISDCLFDKNELESILSDLIIVMNQGGLPSRIFTHQLLSELKEQSQYFDKFSSFDNNLQKAVINKDENNEVNQYISIKAPESQNQSTELHYRESVSKDIRRHFHVIISASIDTIKSMPVRFFL